MANVDIATVLTEGLTEGTIEKRRIAEAVLDEVLKKYSVDEEVKDKLLVAIRDYADGIYDDVYDMAIQAGAELGDMRGYRKAMDEAEDVAAGMIAASLMK